MTTLAMQSDAFTTAPATDADQKAFQQCVQRAADSLFGTGIALRTVQRTRSEYSSSYETEIIDIAVEEGRSARLFLKNYGIFRNPKEDMPARREREMRVFRDLLAPTNLGTPRYYASEWDDSCGRYWLILEYVAAAQLRHVEYKHWVAAIAWLGRMQSHFQEARRDLDDQPMLIRHDEAFFHSVAALASRVVRQLSPQLESQLAGVLRRYDPIVRFIASQPTTLIHGAYRPPNVLVMVGEKGETERICPIDWEEASLGSPLYDVAYISDGFEGPRLDEMWGAYRREAETGGMAVPERDEMQRVVNGFRIHKLFNLLGKSVHRNYPLPSVEKMIFMADGLLKSIQ